METLAILAHIAALKGRWVVSSLGSREQETAFTHVSGFSRKT